MFTQYLSATPRGARLARHLALHQLHAWGIPHGTDLSESAALVVSELAVNAVTHGHVPGRDFELRLTLSARTLRIEVSDARAEPWTPRPAHALSEAGRGLLLVDALTDRWEVVRRDPPPGKTVRAEIDVWCAKD
ncbi:ATP-binding protein [Streptomyces sp. NPDC057877]|uniref:ATP-binding protein n=1 Tax=Streptomyces sp. NPDC057877 TaxID=3346269 RepID=UPI0036BA862A